MRKENNKFIYFLNKTFHHIYTQLVIISLSIFLLFSSDAEVVFLPYSIKPVLIWARNFCLIFFLTEFILSNTLEKSYFLSFYFFIDFIDLVSLASEVSLVWDFVLNGLDSINE